MWDASARLRACLRRPANHQRHHLRPQVNQPVAGTDDVEVVFNDDERVAVFQQATHGAHEFGNVVKVQPRGGLIEQEQHAFFGECLFARGFGFGGFGQEASEF